MAGRKKIGRASGTSGRTQVSPLRGDMNNDNCNPRYVAYAKSQGRTPEQQFEHDQNEYPDGAMIGFILWISETRREFKKQHPACFLHDKIVDQWAWDAFINSKAEESNGTKDRHV